MRSVRGDFSQHEFRARVLSGTDPVEVADQLQKQRNPKSHERRLRQAGLLLNRAGDTEGARRIYMELLERNPAQPLWLKYAAGVPAHDVILLEQYRIAYCPMPKNASSSIKARINFLMQGTNDVYSHRFFTNVYETSQTTVLPDLTNYYSFTVIRDPVERLLSYYQKNIIEEGTLARELEVNRARAILAARPSIEEFVARFESYAFYFDDVHHHTLPQSAYLRSVLPRLSRVYLISEADTIFEELSNRTGVDLEPTYLLKSSVGVRKLLPDLSTSARNKLDSFYREDYELLGPWLDTSP
jgi:hypothetical protein